jgi:hypothetical protein
MHELSVSATLHDIWSNGLTLASFVKGSIAKHGMPDYIFVTQRSERAISFIHDFNTFSCDIDIVTSKDLYSSLVLWRFCFTIIFSCPQPTIAVQ